jgi:hypothetical protein
MPVTGTFSAINALFLEDYVGVQGLESRTGRRGRKSCENGKRDEGGYEGLHGCFSCDPGVAVMAPTCANQYGSRAALDVTLTLS